MSNIALLKDKISKIEKLNWIQVDNEVLGNVGIKIEKLLGIQNNNLEYPDFEGIEIKTKMDCKNKFLTLFNATPDNTFFEIKRIHSVYGYPDKSNNSFKVFNVSLFNKQQMKLSNYSFQLYIDEVNEKIIMLVFDRSGKLVESKVSWSFSMLKDKFERKFNQLCIINVITRKISGATYFHIKNFEIYKCKPFNTLIDSIKEDHVRITFKIGVFKSGKRYGEIHDRVTGFDISIKNIDKIFEKII